MSVTTCHVRRLDIARKMSGLDGLQYIGLNDSDAFPNGEVGGDEQL